MLDDHSIKFYRILSLGLIFLLSSCVYSAKYLASYSVQNKITDNETKEISIDFFNQLADKYSLSKDAKYNGNDTIGYFGRPYHYFKFWFEQRENTTIVILDYWGMYGSRKNQPYRKLFEELDNFMKTKFIIIEQDIKDEN
jgi:hypothetical protein